MVIHFTAASHNVAHILELPAVAGAARNLLLFKDMNVLALHLTVTDKVAGCCKSSKSASYDIGGLSVNALGL